MFPTDGSHTASTLIEGWYGPERDMFGEFRWFETLAEVAVNAVRPWRTARITGRFTQLVHLGCAVAIRPSEGTETVPFDDVACDVLEPRGHGWITWGVRCAGTQPAGRYVVRFEPLQTWRDVSRRNISLAVRGMVLR